MAAHPSEQSEGYPLVAIIGPTASGKSALALALAERLDGEVVNYDSVQIYRGFDVGACKVPPEARRGIPHHMLDIREPEQVFTAGDFRREAQTVLEDLRQRHKLPILVGGTGLYLRALLLGLFEGPARSEGLRKRLYALSERHGREHLHRLLRRLDPQAAPKIQPRDTQKIIRALEVCLLAREPLSKMHARGRTGLDGFRTFKVGLNPNRTHLYDRINRRVEEMFAHGLVEETLRLVRRPEAPHFKPLEALGYRQACAVIRGEMSQDEAIRQTQVATRHYAKRQLTWFRRESDITWFAGFGEDQEIPCQIFERFNLAWTHSRQEREGILHTESLY